MDINDRELLARIIEAEAGNQGIRGKTAVGNVIRNRMAGGNSLRDVVLARGQFSPLNAYTGYAGGEQGQDMANLQPSKDAYAVADAILSGSAKDITGGATHFYNPSISTPSWGLQAGGDWATIGDQVFGQAGGFPVGEVKSRGQTPVPQTKEQAMNAPQAQGLMGLLGRLGQPNEQTGLSPFQNFAQALDPLIMPEMRGGEAIRASGERRMSEQTKNRTIEMLKRRAQQGDAIAAQVLQGVESGAFTPKEGMSLYYGKMMETPKDNRTSQMKNYQFWKAQGYSDEDAAAMVKSGNTITVGGPAGAEDKFFEEKYKALGQQFTAVSKQAGQAGANNLTINALKQLYAVAPSGPVQGRLAELFPEANDVTAAIQALRVQLAPQLRVEGSGSTSDIEYEGMLNSLGSLKNSPQANAALLDLMLVKNDIIQEKAQIAARVGLPKEQGGYTIQEAEQAWLDIDRQMWEESATIGSIKKLIEDAGGFTATSGGQTITTKDGLVFTFEEG
jgi:hypothetical protein